jgi:hypothetical protein
MHPLDRLARFLRAPAYIAAIMALPVSALGYAFMARDLVATHAAWIAWPVLIAQWSGIAAVAFLIDSRQEQARR